MWEISFLGINTRQTQGWVQLYVFPAFPKFLKSNIWREREREVTVYSLNWWCDDMEVDCYISCLLSPGSIDDMIIWWQWDNVTLHCNVTLHYSLPCYIYFLSPLSWISCANWQFARCPQQRTVPTSSHVLPWPLSFLLFIVTIIIYHLYYYRNHYHHMLPWKLLSYWLSGCMISMVMISLNMFLIPMDG